MGGNCQHFSTYSITENTEMEMRSNYNVILDVLAVLKFHPYQGKF